MDMKVTTTFMSSVVTFSSHLYNPDLGPARATSASELISREATASDAASVEAGVVRSTHKEFNMFQAAMETMVLPDSVNRKQFSSRTEGVTIGGTQAQVRCHYF
jgi:hypothetical protein